MEWFTNWKNYTNYNKVKGSNETPGCDDEQSMTTIDEDNTMPSDDIDKAQIQNKNDQQPRS
jgi:hypothetical protein